MFALMIVAMIGITLADFKAWNLGGADLTDVWMNKDLDWETRMSNFWYIIKVLFVVKTFRQAC